MPDVEFTSVYLPLVITEHWGLETEKHSLPSAPSWESTEQPSCKAPVTKYRTCGKERAVSILDLKPRGTGVESVHK